MKRDADKIFDRCMKISGFPKELRHRIYYRFGFFLQEMVDFLIWNKISEDGILSDFEKTLDRSKYDPEKFDTYLELFEKFYEWMDKNV